MWLWTQGLPIRFVDGAQITPNLSNGRVIGLLVNLHRWGDHSRAWFGIRVSPKSTWTPLMSPPHVLWLMWDSEGNFSFLSNVVPQWVLQIIAKSEQQHLKMEFVYVKSKNLEVKPFYKYLPSPWNLQRDCDLISNWRAKHPRHFHPKKFLSHLHGSQKY